MLRNKRIWSFMLILGLVAALVAGCGGTPQKQENIVAKYDGGQITETQYKSFINALKAVFRDPTLAQEIDAGKKDTLQFVLNYQVMSNYVAAKVPETSEIKQQADKNFNQFKTLTQQSLKTQDLKNYYASKNVTEQQLKDFFLQQSKVQQYFSKDITDADMRKKYEEIKASGQLTTADVRHILIDDTKGRSKADAKKKADDLLKELRSGADFAALAKQNSDDPGSKANGGLYKDMQIASTVPQFKQAVMTLPLNKISDPVETEYGYHIIRVEKRTVQPYDQVKQQIKMYMAQDKQSQFLDKNVKTLIKQSNIPASMIKAQPAQPAQPAPGQAPAPSPSSQAPSGSQPAPAQQPAKK
ncbi:peptidylprolyl isomerase [Aneurinibacillus sp. Ricciae_BoGa-3]|uniref:peptidylprolyl isomerase n=1 Tax=Aneurinibacillus sp. Ricciae_BoGa-3 TaxID=3022697 RepID=UPI00234005A9|nr:peptidylprolyl isomerase [Aneurinibacillus sp. Ricciae_BoGa-3]WCK54633.1 peptidylprolyl isomerase [Aneurinibacillus sp. Ricciae_BoGa-3]